MSEKAIATRLVESLEEMMIQPDEIKELLKENEGCILSRIKGNGRQHILLTDGSMLYFVYDHLDPELESAGRITACDGKQTTHYKFINFAEIMEKNQT